MIDSFGAPNFLTTARQTQCYRAPALGPVPPEASPSSQHDPPGTRLP
jgi:hypothetical protein